MLQCPEEEHVDLYEEFLSAARYGELESVTTLFPLVKEQMGQLSFPSSSPTTFLSALHMAAGNGHTDIVTYLIEQGLDMNIVNSEGNTPLHWAALNGHLETVQCLVDKGANVSLKNGNGKTAAFEAQRAQHEEIVHLLIEASFTEERHETETDDSKAEEAHVEPTA